ncbi:MAG: potassium channel protein [Myxococcota bacterium]
MERNAGASAARRAAVMKPVRLAVAASVPFLLVALGTAGYHFIEGWSLFDSLYMTIITLTTVGFLEVHDLSTAGRAFTMALLSGGVFTMFFFATEVIRAVVSGQLRDYLGRQRMERALGSMKDHFVVCGHGRMGRLVCQELDEQKLPFVTIDRNEAVLATPEWKHGVGLVGDATDDAVLRKAGIDRARAVITVVPSDADNLYITLSARLLSERVFIVARAEDPEAESKLTRAGANRVVAPYVIGGSRVVQAVLRPTVLDFIDLATRTQHMALQMEETLVLDGSRLVRRSLGELQLSKELQVIVVAIKRAAGPMLFNPAAETRIEPGDILITLGARNNLDRLDGLARA